MREIEWQDGALYAAMWGGARELFSIVSADDFDPGDRQRLAEILERGLVEQDPENLSQWAYDEAIRLGKPSPPFVAQIMTAGFTGTAGYYGSKLRELSARRRVTEALTRGLQRIQGQESLPETVVYDVKAELDAIPAPAMSNDDTWTIEELMELDDEERRFTIPGLLQRNERLVLTGSEGGGKSVFVYQMLTGAAFGVDTFTQERYEPQRVLFVDVENNEFQARNNLNKIVPALMDMAPGVRPEWRSMKRRVINLIDTRDKADVIRRVVHYAPDVLYMGTAYKLTDITDEAHRAVRAIQSTVDRIREELDCTVIVEHHAGHGLNNDRNSMRPEGSSYWLRWPDFGYGLIPQPVPGHARFMRLQAWRGDRATDRNFPVAIRGGNVMPWVPIYQDEWDAIYAHLDK